MHPTTLQPSIKGGLRRTMALAAVGVSITLLAVLIEVLLWSSPGSGYGEMFKAGSKDSTGWSVAIRRDGRAVFSGYDDRRDLGNSGDIPSWSRAGTPVTLRERDSYLRRFEEAYGHPFPCLVSSQTQTGSDPTWYPEWGLDLRFDVKPNSPRALYPVKPIWAGLLMNACFYAGLAFAASAGFRRVRGAVRSRRGECRACGHPLAGLPRCPECGAEVPKPARA
jgi:hypothetical protein